LANINIKQRRTQMDFIERIFGIAPDNGSGWFEVLLFLTPVVLFAVYQLGKRTLGRGRRH
jgi:hypothetical protein